MLVVVVTEVSKQSTQSRSVLHLKDCTQPHSMIRLHCSHSFSSWGHLGRFPFFSVKMIWVYPIRVSVCPHEKRSPRRRSGSGFARLFGFSVFNLTGDNPQVVVLISNSYRWEAIIDFHIVTYEGQPGESPKLNCLPFSLDYTQWVPYTACTNASARC